MLQKKKSLENTLIQITLINSNFSNINFNVDFKFLYVFILCL